MHVSHDLNGNIYGFIHGINPKTKRHHKGESKLRKDKTKNVFISDDGGLLVKS